MEGATLSEQHLEWHTEQRKIKDLTPHPENPRYMTEQQVETLKSSLERFNLAEVPAVNVDGTILAGHQRVKVMEMLGRGDEIIDVRVPNRILSPEEAKEYLVRSNKNTGEWDWDILRQGFGAADLMTWGFERWELPDMPVLMPEGDEFNDGNSAERTFDVVNVQELAQQGTNEATCPKCGEKFKFVRTKNMAFGRDQYFSEKQHAEEPKKD